MKYLSVIFKAIFRFFKKNIISVISLFTLIFVSSTVFTTLNNSTYNLKSSYSKIVNEGNLHDFVVNEYYVTGACKYKVYDENNNEINLEKYLLDDKLSIPSIVILKPYDWTDGNLKLLNTYKDWVNQGSPDWSNGNEQEKYNYYIFTNYNNELGGCTLTLQGNDDTSKNDEINSKISLLISNVKNISYNFLQNNFMNALLDNGLPVETRVFESLSISINQQNLYYKIINQSWDETIDKIVLYSGHEFSNPKLEDWLDVNEYDSLIDTVKQKGYDHATKEEKDKLLSSGQQLLLELSKSTWSNGSWCSDFSKLYESSTQNNIDPYFGTFKSGKTVQNLFKKIMDEDSFYDKGFSLIINTISGVSPLTSTYTNKRSYEVIVNPEFLKRNNKKIFPYEQWISKISTPEEEFNRWFKNIGDEYKVKVDNTEFIILGAGLSPDFMYPIVSLDKPVPNLKNEVILYLNNTGYDSIQNAFRSAPTENMLLGKFTSKNVNPPLVINKINEIAKQYMNWPSNIKAAFSYDDTSNTITPSAARLVFIPKIVSAIDGISSIILIFISFVAFLVCFILIKRFIDRNKVDIGILLANGYKKWQIILPLSLLFSTVIFLSTILGFLMGFWLQEYALLLFKNFWTIPTIIGIFNPIAFTLFTFGIVLIFAIVIYLVSLYSLKGDATLLIDNNSANRINKFAILTKKMAIGNNPINRIRIAMASTSLFKLLTLCGMSGLLLSVFTFSIASSGKFNESYAKSFNSKNYNFAIDLYTPTVQGGQYMAIPYDKLAMTTYGVSDWNNPNSTSYQLAQYIYDSELEGIDLNELNKSDSRYMDKDQMNGRGYNGAKGNKNNVKFEVRDVLTTYGNYQLPSEQDGGPLAGDFASDKELQYLSYLVQSKMLMNVSIFGTNPWDIAYKLMPQNQALACEDAYRNILSKMTIDTTNTYQSMNKSGTIIVTWKNGKKITVQEGLFKYVDNVSYTEEDAKIDSNIFENLSYEEGSTDPIKSRKYLKIDESKIVSRTALSYDYISLIAKVFTIKEYADINYLMSYNKIPTMLGDKTYSYASININGSSLPEQKIIGISENNKSCVNLLDDKGNDLEEKLLNYDVNSEVIPIIVNKSGLKKLNLKVGDSFNVSIANTIDRLTKGSSLFNLWETPVGKRIKSIPELNNIIVDVDGTPYNGDEYIKDSYTFKIIGELDTYEGVELFTTQEFVNKMIGLAAFDTRNADDNKGNKLGYKGVPFNGVFSSSENPFMVSNSIQFYSPCGLNVGNDKLDSGLKSSLPYQNKKTNDKKFNYEIAKLVTGYTGDAKDIDSFIANVVDTFGNSSYLSITSSVYPTSILKDTFQVMEETIYTIQLFSVSLIMIICFILIILITFTLISDSMKTASLLKTLGFSDVNNSLSLMLIYVPIILIGILLAIPLTIFIAYFYIEFIFSFSGILLNIPLKLWQFLISGSLIIAVFIATCCSIFYQLKKKKLANEIK